MKHLLRFKLFEAVQSYDWKFDGQDGNCWIYYFDDEFGNRGRVFLETIKDGRDVTSGSNLGVFYLIVSYFCV